MSLRPGTSRPRRGVYLAVENGLRMALALVGGNFIFEAKGQADIVPAVQQAVLTEGIDFKSVLQPAIISDRLVR